MTELQIQKVSQPNVPWDLLLLADPSRKHVQAYLKTGDCYAAFLDEQMVGIFVLLWIDSTTMELMNIAVSENFQGQGIGKRLFAEAKHVAKTEGALRLELGTGNSSLDQLAFYQKAGFRISGVIRDFFVKNYPEEIIENGIPCRDMVRLELEF